MVNHSRFKTSDYAITAQKAAAAVRKQKKTLTVTPRIRQAIEHMVHDGMDRRIAAETVGLTDHGLRTAMHKPHVLAYLNEQMEVLRTAARPRALRKMVDLLDAKTERIQFESAKYLDGMDRPSHAVGATQVNVQVTTNTKVETPGYVIDLSEYSRSAQPESGKQIDHLHQHGAKSLEFNEDVLDDE